VGGGGGGGLSEGVCNLVTGKGKEKASECIGGELETQPKRRNVKNSLGEWENKDVIVPRHIDIYHPEESSPKEEILKVDIKKNVKNDKTEISARENCHKKEKKKRKRSTTNVGVKRERGGTGAWGGEWR